MVLRFLLALVTLNFLMEHLAAEEKEQTPSSYRGVIDRKTNDRRNDNNIIRLDLERRHHNHHHHHHEMVGGYQPIQNLHTNVRVQEEIAPFVLNFLIQQQQSSSVAKVYSFQSQLVAAAAQKPHASSSAATAIVVATVVSGTQQVVAGMNYHLTIVVTTKSSSSSLSETTDNNNNNSSSSSSSSSCSDVIIGAFDVVVYDQFGTLSITRYGTEISQSEATVLLERWNHDKSNDADEQSQSSSSFLNDDGN